MTSHNVFIKFLVFFMLFAGLSGKGFSQDSIPAKTLTGNYQRVPLKEFLSVLEHEFSVHIYYQDEWVNGLSVTKEFSDASLVYILDEVFENSVNEYRIIQDNNIVLMPRNKVALARGKLHNYSNNYQASIVEVGNPAEAGKHRMVTLEGKVTDGKTGDPLAGTTIMVENTKFAAVTDGSGHYSFTLPPGLYTLDVASLGFEKTIFNVKLISKGSFDMELFEESQKLDEVVVYAKDAERNVKSTQMSIVEMNSKMIKQLPAVNGEKDIIKSMTMMPGVQSVGEFGSGLNVRGGGEDQNLILIEQTPVFNTSHVFGMLSALNPDIVSDISLYKGHIPARYGERVSSVMDIGLIDNDVKKLSGKGGIGIYNSRLMMSCPVIKDNTSFKVAARSSYSDWILKKIPDQDLRQSSTSFYDITAILNTHLKHNQFSLFGYKSNDEFNYADDYTYSYGNQLASFGWLSIFSPNFSGKLMLSSSSYSVSRKDFGYGQDDKKTDYKLNYLSAKYSLSYQTSNGQNIEGGFQLIRYLIEPGKRTPFGEKSLIEPLELQHEKGREMAAYLSDNFDLTSWLSLNLGIRASMYTDLGPSIVNRYAENTPKRENTIIDSSVYGNGDAVQTYKGIEPRVSFKIQTGHASSVKVSYNRNNQYISLLSYTSIATPMDRWKLSDQYVKPVISDQYAFGYYRNWLNNLLETSVEFYYKDISNLSEFKNDAEIDMNTHIETDLINAEGKNYGAELMLRKNSGDLEGWLSYTYSRSLRKSSGVFAEEMINRNEWFPSSVDKPHNLAIVATYHINKRWRFTGTFNYSTGRSVSLPEYYYNSGGYRIIYYSDRNKYRLPDYHRLDLALSVDESLKRSKFWKGSWTFSIINVYGRKNAYSVYYQKPGLNSTATTNTSGLYKLYIIGIPLPTITYNFIF